MIYVSNLIIFFLLAVAVLYWYLTKHFNYWKSRSIPYKKPIPLFGNFYDIIVKKEPVASYLANLCKEFKGPYFGFFGMIEPFLVVKDPTIIKRILVTDSQAFTEKTFINDESIDPIFSSVLFTLKNPAWGDLKSKLIPIFTSRKLKSMFFLILQSGENLDAYLDGKLDQEIDAKELASKFSTDVIASCAFGLQINAFLGETCEFQEAVRKQFSPNLTRALQPLAYIFAHPLVKLFKLKFIETEAANYLRRVLTKTLKERENKNVRRDDLIDTLLILKNQKTKKDGFQLSGDRLVAQAIIFYIVGYEGISNAIALTLLELAIQPALQVRLRKEIQDVVNMHGKVTYDAIQEMKYLFMVVSETLRKYTFTAFLHRRCTENYVISETGFVVERGLKILIPLYGLHTDPQYFPEPQKYDPERFSDERKSNIPEYSYLPFGNGPRSCIGNRFALLAIQIGIVKLLMRYQVEKGVNVKYPLQFRVSLFPNARSGIALIFKKLHTN